MNKMKRLFFSVLFFVIIVLFVPSLYRQVYALSSVVNTSEVKNITETATRGGDIVIPKKSDYTLPYSGILHDHPLYFLKELRDKVIEVLIVDPVRKTDFYILQSDKWINSVQLLLAKNQRDLAKKVLFQSVERMRMAVNQLITIQKEGREIPQGTIEKINSSIEKHLEIVDELSVTKELETNIIRDSYLSIQEDLMKLNK